MGVFISASNTPYINIIERGISLLLIIKNSSSKMRPFEFYVVDKLIIYVVVCKALKLILGSAFIVFIRGPPCWFEFQISD